jgi:hypothetical protein
VRQKERLNLQGAISSIGPSKSLLVMPIHSPKGPFLICSFLAVSPDVAHNLTLLSKEMADFCRAGLNRIVPPQVLHFACFTPCGIFFSLILIFF